MIRVRERRVVELKMRESVYRPRLEIQQPCGFPRQDRRASLCKIVIRRLPPSMTKEQLEEQLNPLPAHDYFEFFAAEPSLHPYLFSRAYIHFRNPEDIILFRDRFDGYVFVDSKGTEYPAVVEYAPFQKISKKKLKKTDVKAGSIEEDPEYKTFLENYSAADEKVRNALENLLGEIEAKTRELIAKRTTPLLEYIKIRKIEKQKMREEKREERKRRELERKRLREEEKRKRKEDERRKRKELEKQKKITEKDTQIQLLKKSDKGDESATEKRSEMGERDICVEVKQEKPSWSGSMKSKQLETLTKDLKEMLHINDKEAKNTDKTFHNKEPERQRYWLDDSRKHRTNYEFARRNVDDFKWGKSYSQERGKRGNHYYSFSVESIDKLGKEDECDDLTSKKERIRNKDRPAMQLYQPGAHNRTHTGFTSKTSDCSEQSPVNALDQKYERDDSEKSKLEV